MHGPINIRFSNYILQCWGQEWKNSISRQAIYIQRSIEVRSCNHCCSWRAINVTYAECVFVSLGIQHAVLMYIIYGLFGSTLSHKRHDFRKNVTEHKILIWFYLQLLSDISQILRINERNMTINVYRSSCKISAILAIF